LKGEICERCKTRYKNLELFSSPYHKNTPVSTKSPESQRRSESRKKKAKEANDKAMIYKEKEKGNKEEKYKILDNNYWLSI